MTTESILKSCSATKAYIDYIASGKGDFDANSSFLLKHIDQSNNAACAIKILNLTVTAYESYLKNTLWGRIQSIFHMVFGNNSNYESAKKILSDRIGIIAICEYKY